MQRKRFLTLQNAQEEGLPVHRAPNVHPTVVYFMRLHMTSQYMVLNPLFHSIHNVEGFSKEINSPVYRTSPGDEAFPSTRNTHGGPKCGEYSRNSVTTGMLPLELTMVNQ